MILPRLFPGLLKTVAAGHIVTGYRHRQPTYIKMAASILQSAKQQQSRFSPSSSSSLSRPAALGSGAVDADIFLMQSVCQLLLGEVEGSLSLLKQAETAAASAGATDSQWATGAYTFVEQSSLGGDDDGLLPGLCLLTEKWLNNVRIITVS